MDTTPERIDSNEVHGAIVAESIDPEPNHEANYLFGSGSNHDVFLFKIMPGDAPLTYKVEVSNGGYADFNAIYKQDTLGNAVKKENE